MTREPVRVKHFANAGDIIASLAGLKELHKKINRKIIYSQQLNVPADYYQGAIHPVVSDSGDGVQVMCNQKMFDMIKPLLESQEYIERMEIFKGQLVNINLDVIRKEEFVNIPNQALQQWTFMAFPDMATDLTKAWVEIGEVDISNCYLINPSLVTEPSPLENIEDKIILNFTERYRNPIIHYYFLKKYEKHLIFAGTEGEYLKFTKQWELKIPRLVVKDFLQLAYIIKKSKFILANQSFCWNMAEAMKSPRIVELSEFAPNCQAFIGEDSYGFLKQQGAEYYFKLLMKK